MNIGFKLCYAEETNVDEFIVPILEDESEKINSADIRRAAHI
jgi:hypothetical protein